MTDLQVVSLFAGIGGIDRGLELAGASTALLCEKDKHARNILARHYPQAVIHNDVTELTADDCRAAGAVPGRTVLTAGWPCQGNSVAGARGGMDDPRSGLWSHVVRLLAEHRPAWFIGENVPGLLSVNDGRDFSIVVHDLARLGYGFTWRVLDARHFGVPQRRRRVVIVGRLGDTGAAAAQVLLEPEGLSGNPAEGIEPRPRLAGDARESVKAGRWHADIAPTLSAPSGGSRRYGTDADTAESLVVVGILGDQTHTLTAEGHDASEDGTGRGTPVIAYAPTFVPALTTRSGNTQDDQQTGQVVAFDLRGRDEGALPEVHRDGSTVGSLRAAGGGSSRDYIAFAENQRGELAINPTMPALKVGGGKPGQGYPAVTDGMIVRRLSPRECERLQGLPDGWTEGQADSQRYKQLGNSVAVPVFEWVGRRLVAVDNQLNAPVLKGA
jgi:DNA (cytosine-5)-methyltransferase 1